MTVRLRTLSHVATVLLVAGGWATAGPAATEESATVSTGRVIARADLPDDPAPALTDTSEKLPASEWVAIDTERLDTMRGGFDLGGLKVSFGIEKAVYVNGNLVTSTSFNIPDVGSLTMQQAQMLASVNAMTLVQNGMGNSAPATLPATTGTIIQNTLNNQHIQALTTINTSVNTLNLFKGLNLQSTLSNALAGVARVR
jgi:hypothetical protein